MAILKRNDILAKKDLPRELVSVPEWDGEVYVRGLSAAELDRYQTSMLQQRGKNRVTNLENVRSKLVVLCAVDEDGKRLFEDGDMKALSEKSGSAVNRLFEVAQKLCGLGSDDVAEMAEEMAGDPFDGSPSA